MKRRNVSIDLDYTPRPWQARVHQGMRNKRRGLWICSRQIGKTTAAVPELIERSVAGPSGADVAYLCPAASQAKKIVWPQMLAYLAPLTEYITISRSDMSVTLPGERRIYILGAQAGENLRGMSLHTLVVDERDSIDNEFFTSVMLPTLNNYPDIGTILYIGTLKGRALWDMYVEHRDDPSWFCAVIKGSESGCYSKEHLAQMRHDMGRSAFLREIECDPNAPVEHSVLGERVAEAEAQGRVCRLPYRTGHEVNVCFDLGIRDFTAVWGYMLVGHAIEWIFYREFEGVGLTDVITHLYDEFPSYNWGEAVLPHDGKNRDKCSAFSVRDLFYERWRGHVFTYQSAPSPVATLQSSRINLDRSYFDARNTERGLIRLKQARYNASADGTVLDTIQHDDNSHGLDAFRYGTHRIETQYSSAYTRGDMGRPAPTPRVLGTLG